MSLICLRFALLSRIFFVQLFCTRVYKRFSFPNIQTALAPFRLNLCAVDDLNLGDPRKKICVNYHAVNYSLICLEKAVLLGFSKFRLAYKIIVN